jgi:TPR repeat protein
MMMEDLTSGIEAFREKNYTKALRILEPLAAQGNAEAQCIVGSIYHLGLGIEINSTEAAKWYLLSSRQGNALASNNLAGMYFMGDYGITQNHEEALRLCRLSQDQGFEDAKKLETYILSNSDLKSN